MVSISQVSQVSLGATRMHWIVGEWGWAKPAAEGLFTVAVEGEGGTSGGVESTVTCCPNWEMLGVSV